MRIGWLWSGGFQNVRISWHCQSFQLAVSEDFHYHDYFWPGLNSVDDFPTLYNTYYMPQEAGPLIFRPIFSVPFLLLIIFLQVKLFLEALRYKWGFLWGLFQWNYISNYFQTDFETASSNLQALLLHFLPRLASKQPSETSSHHTCLVFQGIWALRLEMKPAIYCRKGW